MQIRNDQENFDTDDLCAVDRIAVDHVIVILKDKTLDLRGQAAIQAWAQLTELETVIEPPKPLQPKGKSKKRR